MVKALDHGVKASYYLQPLQEGTLRYTGGNQ
jgi:hypothetical protein